MIKGRKTFNNKMTLRQRLNHFAIMMFVTLILTTSLNFVSFIPSDSSIFKTDFKFLVEYLNENFNKTPQSESDTHNNPLENEGKEVFMISDLHTIFFFCNVQFSLKNYISKEFYNNPFSEKFTPLRSPVNYQFRFIFNYQ